MMNKYAVKAAEYEVMSEVLEYLERLIDDNESEVERVKKQLSELTDSDYKDYYVDRIDEYATKVEACKAVQAMFIDYFN